MPPRFISIKDFDKYQHFKKANPPWVKMYRSTFSDREFMRLPVSSKFLYLGLVMLASEGCNRVPYDLHYISHRLATDFSQSDLTPLYKAGLLEAAISTVYRVSSLSEETETETETETPIVPFQGTTGFDEFWKAYPRKTGKEAARKAWDKAKGKPVVDVMISTIEKQKASAQWKKDGGQFIPNPATWLNQGRWSDEIVESAGLQDPNGFLAGMQAFLQRGQR